MSNDALPLSLLPHLHFRCLSELPWLSKAEPDVAVETLLPAGRSGQT